MTETVREGIAIGALGISRQVEVGPKDTIQFEVAIDQTADLATLHEILDNIRLASERQKAFSELPLLEKKLFEDLAVAEQSLTICRQQVKTLTTEYAAQYASYQAAHEVSGRRSAFKLTAQEQQNLSNIENSRVKFQGDIPICEENVERLKRLVVAGGTEEMHRLRRLIGIEPMEEPLLAAAE